MTKRISGIKGRKLAGITAGVLIAVIVITLPSMASGDNRPDSYLMYTDLNLSDQLPFGKLISLVFKDMLVDHETELKITMLNVSTNNSSGIMIIKAEKNNIEKKIKELEIETSELREKKNSSKMDDMEYLVELHRIKIEAESIHKESDELEKKIVEISSEDEDDLNVTEINQIKNQAINISGNITDAISQILGINISADSIKKLEIEQEEGKTKIEAKITQGNQTINIEIEQKGNITSKAEIEIKSSTTESKSEIEDHDSEDHSIKLWINDTESGSPVKIHVVNLANTSIDLNGSKLYILHDENPVKIFNLTGTIAPFGNTTIVWDQNTTTNVSVSPGEYRVLLVTSTGKYDESFKIVKSEEMKNREMKKVREHDD